MERKLLLYALPFFGLSILIDFCADVFKKTNRYYLNDSITSLSTGYLGTTLGLLSVGLTGALYHLFYDFRFYTVPDNICGIVIASLVYDFFYYWYHRAHHRINLLWAAHSAHHNSEYFNFTTALRQSALIFLTTWIFFIPMAFMGFSLEQYLFGAALSVIYGFFTHTEFLNISLS